MIALYIGAYLLLVVFVSVCLVYYFKVIRPKDEAELERYENLGP